GTGKARSRCPGAVPGQDRDRLGPSNPQLRAAAVPDGEGSAHRCDFQQPRRRPRRRNRRLHRRCPGAAGHRRNGRGGGRGLRLSLAFAAALALTACEQAPEADLDRPETAREFPRAHRPVSELGRYSVATEQTRDDRNEAATVMDLAAMRPALTWADTGAGDGTFTLRLAGGLGGQGPGQAQDFI